ncbi:MAG: choice-of-anchor D domain-containing protein [Candidatus Kapabacteria bacterium]|nr:choice-of-anchor D domain-containing protein [Candidatus Kapabacteria bacterium]
MKSLFFLCLLLSAQTLYSQSIELFDIDASGFPLMKAKFLAFDAQRKQQSPNIGDMTLKENGELCTITNITCPPPKQRVLSVCIMVDTKYYIDIARLGTQRLIGFLDMPQEDEVAVTYMEGRAAIWQDFTKDKDKALVKAQSIPLAPGVDVNTMFYSDYTGGIPMIKDRSSEKKVLILVSDLHCPNLNIDEAKVIADAKKYNISIYTVLLGTTDYTKLFSRIAAGTSGKVFENVNDAQQIENVFDTIAIRENSIPCTIEWEAQPACIPRKEIELNWENVRIKDNYQIPPLSIMSLETSPNYWHFDNPPIGTLVSKDIIITARNTTFAVTNIISSNPLFTISPTKFSLQPNESKTLTVSYTAIDSNYTFARFTIENDVCQKNYSVSGGYRQIIHNIKTLKLTFPNGGETFIAGSDTILTWEGIPDYELCKLEYSIDNGKHWIYLDTSRNLSYHWKNIPLPASKECLVKVQQLASLRADTLGQLLYTINENQVVATLAFSPDGKILASAGSKYYEGVKLWNVSTKDTIRRLGVYNKVYGLDFSPDGKMLAVSCDDGIIYLYNVLTGDTIRTLKGHTTAVMDVEFSPNGIILASGSLDSTIKIWNSTTGDELATLRGHNQTISCVAFSPTENILATGSSNLKLWDLPTATTIHTLTNISPYIYGLGFSPDGNIIAAGGEFDKIKLWNVATGELYTTLNGSGVDYNHGVAFSPDGNSVISVGNWYICVWNIVTGEMKRFNTWGKNYSATLSDDGTILATGGDSQINFWAMSDKVLQEDQSDAVFSIIAPAAVLEKRNIDMGKVLVGSSKDTMVTAVLCNKGDAVLHVLGVDVTNGDRNEFIVPRGAGEFYLEPNTPDNCRAMMFAFMPNRVGKRTAQITVRTTIGDFIDSIEITGEGIQPQLAIAEKFIDFGKVGVGDSKDSLKCATIQNIGTVPITIIRTSYGLPNDKDFSTITGKTSFVLNPGAPQLMDLRFSPSDSGRTSGTLEFHYNGLGSPAIIQLFGEGITVSARGAIKTNNISGYAGEEIEIPIQLISQENIAQSGITSIDMELSFNPTLLSPIGYSVEIINDTLGKISMKNILIIAESGKILHTIRCIVGLGNAEQCSLDLSNLTLYGGTANINIANGKFTLLGICEEGGTRLINPGKATSLMRIHPNPSKGIMSVDLELIEQGLTKVRIMDIQGNVMVERELIDAIGSTTVLFDMEKYGAGVYYIEVRTPTIVRKEKIIIEK